MRGRTTSWHTIRALTLLTSLLCIGGVVHAQAAACSSGHATYPGDAATPAAIAAWMSVHATSRGIPGELPVIAALARSELSNRVLDRSGRAGYFGMSDNVWGIGPYAGFHEDPQIQLDWFINQMIAVRDGAIRLGARQFGDRETQWGVWIQLALFIGRPESYLQRLAEARALIATGCSQPPPGFCSGLGQYPGDDAPKSAIAGWMAARAIEAGIPPELPIMAALVDSGLQNLSFGDRDSVGYFQMRVSIWNTGPYAGFPDQPELQIKWFLDQAAAVRAARIAAGDLTFGTDPLQWGEWVADVQRPPEQFRGRYQLQLDDARALIELACDH